VLSLHTGDEWCLAHQPPDLVMGGPPLPTVRRRQGVRLSSRVADHPKCR
jgi:hypothetical protein